ncbi:oxidoreductase-like protein [Bipolaris maydis]|uniref:oxidoreductase-like protein n=1 Tax=Cochliobolus heterostrophus TaxID=5016 RepID=UPI0024D92BC1|nr:oxidoreductase-like protein [Bipolaris maydis]KAJ6276064.1 oxidoreductase-like protein [Bipolaris maydis]KAJ6287207.1 oxidoreductase-like protein [Bipolaris maydis]
MTPTPTLTPQKANLKGEIVVITGASKGLGKATVISYAQAGASNMILAAHSSLDPVVSAVRAFEINVKGPYLMFHAFYPLLLNSPVKTWINVVSIIGVTTLQQHSGYSLSKLVALRLTQYIDQGHGEGKECIGIFEELSENKEKIVEKDLLKIRLGV